MASLEKSESVFNLKKVKLKHMMGMHNITYCDCCECKSAYLNIGLSPCHYFLEVLRIHLCYQCQTKCATHSLDDFELCYVQTSFHYAGTLDCLVSFFFPPLHRSPCTIRSDGVLLYDINLGATHTAILSTRGVTIPIYLVSNSTDSIK